MNAFQKKLCETYAGGEFAHFAEKPDQWRDAIKDCGDGLFSFLMIELSDKEDCENLDTAIQRLESAGAQIQKALSDISRLALTKA